MTQQLLMLYPPLEIPKVNDAGVIVWYPNKDCPPEAESWNMGRLYEYYADLIKKTEDR